MIVRRVMALTLAAVMCLGLAACGGKDNENKDDTNTPVVQQPVEDNTPDTNIDETPSPAPEQNDEKEPEKETEKEPEKEPEKPISEYDVLENDPGAYIPDYISTADYLDITDVKYTSILVPAKYYSDSVNYSDYFEALLLSQSTDKRKDPDKYNKLQKIIQNNVVIEDKDTFFIANYTDDIIIRTDIMTNNVNWTTEDLTEAQLKYLMDKLNMDEFGEVTVSIIDSIPYASDGKVVAKVSSTSLDGDSVGYLAVVLHRDYMATVLVAGDPDKTDLDWMLYTAKSLKIIK